MKKSSGISKVLATLTNINEDLSWEQESDFDDELSETDDETEHSEDEGENEPTEDEDQNFQNVRRRRHRIQTYSDSENENEETDEETEFLLMEQCGKNSKKAVILEDDH